MLAKSMDTFVIFSEPITNPYFNFLIITGTNKHPISIDIFELELIICGDLFVNTNNTSH